MVVTQSLNAAFISNADYFEQIGVHVNEAWIIDAARTPRGIGKIGKGALADLHPQRILSTVLRALAVRNGLQTIDIDEVVIGCNTQFGKQGYCIARMAQLDAGYDEHAPAFTLERFCGSGLTAIGQAVMGVASGMQDLVVAGGVESMSHAATLGMGTFIDSGNLHLRKAFPQPHQGISADLVATLEGIDREALDAYALQSQRRAHAAISQGFFDRSLISVHDDAGNLLLDRDEYPRPQTTAENLAALRPAFEALYRAALDEQGTTFASFVDQKYPSIEVGHVHTAGNSSGVVDGAGAVVIASPAYAKAHGLKPRARIRAVATAGDDPTLMLNAPVPAARRVLDRAGMTIGDIDLFEVNEAFAVVPIKFMRDLDVDPAQLNVNGGAIALGHPIGATGAILIGTLLDEIERRDLSTGLVTMCTAGGMAPAVVIERI